MPQCLRYRSPGMRVRIRWVTTSPHRAYAQMQIVEQAIVGTNSLDDAKLAEFTRDMSFKTVLGDIKFGAGGGWSKARVLQVPYQNIRSANLADFKDASTQAVVWPSSLASGALIYPAGCQQQQASRDSHLRRMRSERDSKSGQNNSKCG